MGGPPNMGMGFGPMPPPQSNQLAIVSLVCGLVAFPGMCCCYTSIPFGIIALVTGILALRRANAQPETYGSGKGMAIAGIACGAVVLILTLAAFTLHLTSRMPHYAP